MDLFTYNQQTPYPKMHRRINHVWQTAFRESRDINNSKDWSKQKQPPLAPLFLLHNCASHNIINKISTQHNITSLFSFGVATTRVSVWPLTQFGQRRTFSIEINIGSKLELNTNKTSTKKKKFK